MTEEQEEMAKALQIALQMEVDGKEFYLKASQQSSNELGRGLFNSLAQEEDYHRRKFSQIYDSIRARNAWPIIDFQPDFGQKLRTMFARAIDSMGSDIDTGDSELDAVQTAMDMENKSRDYYLELAGKTAVAEQKEFYEAVADEEREHHIVLMDYFDFLKDPAGWFVNKEHPSLDGG